MRVFVRSSRAVAARLCFRHIHSRFRHIHSRVCRAHSRFRRMSMHLSMDRRTKCTRCASEVHPWTSLDPPLDSGKCTRRFSLVHGSATGRPAVQKASASGGCGRAHHGLSGNARRRCMGARLRAWKSPKSRKGGSPRSTNFKKHDISWNKRTGRNISANIPIFVALDCHKLSQVRVLNL